MGAGMLGRLGEKTRSKHMPLAAGSLEQEPQFPEDFATLPPGGQRRDLCSGFFCKMTIRERGLEGLQSEEADMDRPEAAQEEQSLPAPHSPSPPHSLLLFTRLSNRPTSSHHQQLWLAKPQPPLHLWPYLPAHLLGNQEKLSSH